MSRLFEEADKKQLRLCGAPGTRYLDQDFNPEKNGTGSLLPRLPCRAGKRGDRRRFVRSRSPYGNYSTLSESYGAALKWIEENGYAIVNAPYELYLSDPRTDPDPADWKTEIFSGHSKVVSGRSTGFCRATQPAMTKSEKQSSRNL